MNLKLNKNFHVAKSSTYLYTFDNYEFINGVRKGMEHIKTAKEFYHRLNKTLFIFVNGEALLAEDIMCNIFLPYEEVILCSDEDAEAYEDLIGVDGYSKNDIFGLNPIPKAGHYRKIKGKWVNIDTAIASLIEMRDNRG